MNIIQMQDKLKDLSNKQLMYYIENPQISSGAMTGSSLGQGGANTLNLDAEKKCVKSTKLNLNPQKL